MNYFQTSKVDQSLLESDFGVYRSMDGCNVDPNGLELNWRISRRILDRVLCDEKFDITQLKIPLQNHLNSLRLEDNYGEDEFEDDFDYETVPDDLPLEEVEVIENEEGDYVTRLKKGLKEDELEGLKWVCFISVSTPLTFGCIASYLISVFHL